jgi:uncharacterized protein
MLSKIQEDLKEAMFAKDETKVSTLRMLISELNNAKIAKGGELEENEITPVIQREVKKRREAAVAFKNAGRATSSQKEEDEARILEGYLPTQMTQDEISALVMQVIEETEATSMADMGKVMASLKDKVGASADPSRISQMVKSKLNG